MTCFAHTGLPTEHVLNGNLLVGKPPHMCKLTVVHVRVCAPVTQALCMAAGSRVHNVHMAHTYTTSWTSKVRHAWCRAGQAEASDGPQR